MKPSDLQPIIDAVNRLAPSWKDQLWEHANTIVVGLTFLVLIWYTWETYRLRKTAQQQITETDKLLAEAQSQNKISQDQNSITAKLLAESQAQTELSIQPMFALHTSEIVRGIEPELVLTNVGRGPGYNITVVCLAGDNKRFHIHMQNNVMKPGDREHLSFSLYENKELKEKIFWVSRLSQEMETKDIPNPLRLYVRCDDLRMNFYEFWFDFEVSDGNSLITFLKLDNHRKRA